MVSKSLCSALYLELTRKKKEVYSQFLLWIYKNPVPLWRQSWHLFQGLKSICKFSPSESVILQVFHFLANWIIWVFYSYYQLYRKSHLDLQKRILRVIGTNTWKGQCDSSACGLFIHCHLLFSTIIIAMTLVIVVLCSTRNRRSVYWVTSPTHLFFFSNFETGFHWVTKLTRLGHNFWSSYFSLPEFLDYGHAPTPLASNNYC